MVKIRPFVKQVHDAATMELAQSEADESSFSPAVQLTEAELQVINDPQFNAIEAFLLTLPQTPYPLREMFIEQNGRLHSGMYIREVCLPPFTVFTTEIHNTRHPFVISRGRVKTWTRKGGWLEMRAPHTGITERLTRRLITTFEEPTIWTTFHATNETDAEKIKQDILISHALVPNKSADIVQLIGQLK